MTTLVDSEATTLAVANSSLISFLILVATSLALDEEAVVVATVTPFIAGIKVFVSALLPTVMVSTRPAPPMVSFPAPVVMLSAPVVPPTSSKLVYTSATGINQL